MSEEETIDIKAMLDQMKEQFGEEQVAGLLQSTEIQGNAKLVANEITDLLASWEQKVGTIVAQNAMIIIFATHCYPYILRNEDSPLPDKEGFYRLLKDVEEKVEKEIKEEKEAGEFLKSLMTANEDEECNCSECAPPEEENPEDKPEDDE